MAVHPIGLIGIPFDAQSSYLRGSSGAPTLVRAAWRCPSSNQFSENGTLVDGSLVTDLGDVQFSDPEDPFSSIERKAEEALGRGFRPICIGGDHSITFPVVKAISRAQGKLSILHVDAHPDLYDTYEGNPLSHACPFARIMEAGLATRLVQVGIRAMSQHQRDQAARFGVEVHEMKDWTEWKRFSFDGPLYISLDIDAIDPAHAPGVSHREPGGLSTRQVIGLIQTVEGSVVGADIVEFNPERDVPGITDMVCAKLLKELAARMSREGP